MGGGSVDQGGWSR